MQHLTCRLLAGLLLAALLAACATTGGYRRPGFQLAEAQDILFAPPVSAVAIVRTGYRTTVDSQATATSVQLLHKLLVRHRFQLRLHHELPMPDSLRLAARHEIYQAIEGIRQHPRLAGGANLPVLDYLLASQDERYLLVTAAAGFTQVPTRYDAQQARGYMRGQSVLSGTPAPRPLETRSKSEIFLFLYDAQQRAIVYYSSTPPLLQREPLDEASLEGQFSQMLRKDFPIISK